MNLKRFFIFGIIAVFFVALMASCSYAPRQPWTPKYKSYKKGGKKR